MRCGRAVLALALLVGCGRQPEPANAPDAGAGQRDPKAAAGPALQIVVRDGDDLQPLPARMLVAPVAPTKMPNFRSDGWTAAFVANDVLGAPEGVLLVTGRALLPFPDGTYDLSFLQGPEYEMVRRRVTIGPKAVAPVDVTLEHTVHTDGWMAADMHLHTRLSGDSKVAAHHRVISEVASGIRLLVPTEHTYHNDLQPQIDELGYTQRAVSIPGSEYGFDLGHIGVYPVRFDPRGRFYGAPAWEEWPWRSISAEVYFPQIHALAGDPLIIINHPRLPPDLGFFHNLRWRPGQPLPALDLFDGIEVLSGYENSPHETTALLSDWFYLLNLGRRVVGLGNSDTHRIDWLRAGYPRTWLHLATDEPVRVLPEDLREALLSMRAVASNGPFVNLKVNGEDLGALVNARAGHVTARVVADAPGWIDLTRVLLYQNGNLLKEIPVTQRRHPALTEEVEVPVSADGWLVAVAVGDLPLPVEVIGAVKNGMARPFAFTNPVWLDADGDGRVKMAPAAPPQPQPFGAMFQTEEPRTGLGFFDGLPLHAPLDCEPAAWLR